jgi:hypothetical protein
VNERRKHRRTNGESQDAEKAQGKLVPFSLRDRLHELRGGELALWLAYWLHSNPDGLAFPGRKLLLKETWLNADVITRLRRQLVQRGWLVPAVRQRKTNGQFSSSVFIVQIPPPRSDKVSERPKRSHHGKFPRRSDKVPTHRSDTVSEHRSDKVSELSTTSKNYIEVLQKNAPSGARSPTVLGFGASPSGSPENKEKEKPSLEEGNGFSFNGRCLKVTPEQEQQIAEFLPLQFERNSQLTALDESLREAPADAVVAVEAWVKSEKAMQLKDYLRSRGWIK